MGESDTVGQVARPQNNWYAVLHKSGLYTIVNHRWPEYANIVLLDDERQEIYVPGGANSYDHVLYRKYSYWEIDHEIPRLGVCK